jgi:hypothetical protein
VVREKEGERISPHYQTPDQARDYIRISFFLFCKKAKGHILSRISPHRSSFIEIENDIQDLGGIDVLFAPAQIYYILKAQYESLK